MNGEDNEEQEPAPVAGQLRICQQNLNKSPQAQQDFLNTTDPSLFDIVAIQEPWKSRAHLTSVTSKWRAVYPSQYYDSDDMAAATRSVLLVSTAVSTNAWTVIDVQSPDVTAVELRTATQRVRLFNIYNDCNNDSALEAVEEAITQLREADAQDARETVMVWLGDFNRHHPTWDEARNEHLFTRANMEAAERLI